MKEKTVTIEQALEWLAEKGDKAAAARVLFSKEELENAEKENLNDRLKRFKDKWEGAIKPGQIIHSHYGYNSTSVYGNNFYDFIYIVKDISFEIHYGVNMVISLYQVELSLKDGLYSYTSEGPLYIRDVSNFLSEIDIISEEEAVKYLRRSVSSEIKQREDCILNLQVEIVEKQNECELLQKISNNLPTDFANEYKERTGDECSR